MAILPDANRITQAQPAPNMNNTTGMGMKAQTIVAQGAYRCSCGLCKLAPGGPVSASPGVAGQVVTSNGSTIDPTYQTTIAFPGFDVPALTFGTTNVQGTGGKAVDTGATIAIFDTTVPVIQALGDIASTGSAGVAARRDHKHGMPAFATPALSFGTANSAGVATTPFRSDATLALFDATVPVTQAMGDAAAAGSAGVAARRDHKHGMPSTAPPSGSAGGDLGGSYPNPTVVSVADVTTGTLGVAHGGSGNTTFTAYSVLCAGTTATGAFQNVSGVGTSGQILTSNGASALPTWQTVTSSGLTVIGPTFATSTTSIASANTFTTGVTLGAALINGKVYLLSGAITTRDIGLVGSHYTARLFDSTNSVEIWSGCADADSVSASDVTITIPSIIYSGFSGTPTIVVQAYSNNAGERIESAASGGAASKTTFVQAVQIG